jgi:hypothetical protein
LVFAILQPRSPLEVTRTFAHLYALFHSQEQSQRHEARLSTFQPCTESTGESGLETWVGRFLLLLFIIISINNPCIHLLVGFIEYIARRLSV